MAAGAGVAIPRRSQPSRMMISAMLASERRSASAARSSTVRTLGSTRKLKIAVFVFSLGIFVGICPYKYCVYTPLSLQ